MLSQFFILSARGDTIITRDCKKALLNDLGYSPP
jgi:hypothetical protein